MPLTQLQLNTESNLIERLHPSIRTAFLPLPPIDIPLTREQEAVLFCGDVEGVVRQLVALTLAVTQGEKGAA